MQNNDLFLIVSPLCFDTTADTVDGFNPAFSFLFFNDIIYLLKLRRHVVKEGLDPPLVGRERDHHLKNHAKSMKAESSNKS